MVMKWGSVVHRGSSFSEGGKAVEFKDFFSMLKKRISDGLDIPHFFRELISMITDVPESEWGGKKDPSKRELTDSSIRTYAKRKLSSNFAKSIVLRLSPEMFIESLNSRPVSTLTLLAADYSVIDPTADSGNIAEKLAYCFVDIIKRAAGEVDAAHLKEEQIQQQELDLRVKYGDYLLCEANYKCPYPGCGHSLTVSESGKLKYLYNVVIIDERKGPEVGNLMALCPNCHARLNVSRNNKITRDLSSRKRLLIASQQSKKLLDDMPLEEGIIGVVSKIKKIDSIDPDDISLDPKDVSQKLNPSDDFVLYNTVHGFVTSYFTRIKKLMREADKRKEIDYEEVQDQIRAMYRKLKKAKKSNMEIFTEIYSKIHRVTMEEELYCQIVVAYFIQSCEVFDAVAE